MVLWAPFPLSRIPVSIEHFMKLLCGMKMENLGRIMGG